MKSIINPDLFKHREVTTNGFNNLCTIIHPIKDVGIYFGDVFMNKQYLGRFTLECDSTSPLNQTNIDLSHFDPLFSSKKLNAEISSPVYNIKPGGFLILFATKHHTGLYVSLEMAVSKKSKKAFDSRELKAGDFVSVRLVTSGDFIASNTQGKQQMGVHVRTAKEGKYYHPSKVEPLQVTLNEKSFSEKEVSIQPFQAILIKLEATCTLDVKESQKPTKQKEKKMKK